jgi:hypothetical protein
MKKLTSAQYEGCGQSSDQLVDCVAKCPVRPPSLLQALVAVATAYQTLLSPTEFLCSLTPEPQVLASLSLELQSANGVLHRTELTGPYRADIAIWWTTRLLAIA